MRLYTVIEKFISSGLYDLCMALINLILWIYLLFYCDLGFTVIAAYDTLVMAYKMVVYFLYNHKEIFTIFYSVLFAFSTKFLSKAVFSFGNTFGYIFLANNAYYIQLALIFVLVLISPNYYKTLIISRKVWIYSTIYTLLTVLFKIYVSAKFWTVVPVEYIHIVSQDEINYNLLKKYIAFYDNDIKKIGLLFSALVSYIFVLCSYFRGLNATKLEILSYIFLEWMLLQAFSTRNFLWFYICFESVLIPMLYLILVKGSNHEKRVLAGYYLVLYTVIFSIPLLIAIIYLGIISGSYDILDIKLIMPQLSFEAECWIFWSLFLGFAVKVPLFPFHIWLPEAHVNAPTTASVILASLLLKLGGYGIIFFLFYICKRTTLYFSSVIVAYTIINIVFGSIAALVQVDLKRIIAYSSIAHMGLVVLGIFAIEYNAFIGSIYQMIAHGITSAGLFFIAGFMYDRLSVRNVSYYGGLVMVMPLLSTSFFFFVLGNISFPGTANFVGELLLYVGIFKTNPVGGSIALFGAFLGTVYSLWTFNRVFFGTLPIHTATDKFSDFTRREAIIIIHLILMLIVLGVYPNAILYFLDYIKYFYFPNTI